MDTQSLTQLASIAEVAIGKARATLLEVQHDMTVFAKGTLDVVTNADLAVEEAVKTFLTAETPEIGFLGEESGASSESSLRWTLDPVDGTVNFSRGLPTFAMSLALLDGASAVVAVTDAPRLDERYNAVLGAGSTLNGRPIRARTSTGIDASIVCLDDYAPGARHIPERAAIYAALAPNVLRVRTTGSAALDLAWLAAGRVDAVIMLSNKPWDTAPGVLLAKEAGAKVVDLRGDPHSTTSSSLLAGTGEVLHGFLELVTGAVGRRDWDSE